MSKRTLKAAIAGCNEDHNCNCIGYDGHHYRLHEETGTQNFLTIPKENRRRHKEAWVSS